MKKKKILSLLLISVFPLFIIAITLPASRMFGAQIDWLSQHVSIPEYFRSLYLETGTLFPDYAAHLQAGANIYDFSYYGLFRPDVLIAYLLPMIEMKTIIISYSIFLISLGGASLYIWLQKKQYHNTLCIFAAIVYMCSAIFFQSHKQIMFVNFMPFLILALLSIDYFIKTKKSMPLSICIIFIILHSYFFSIAAIIVCFFYFIYETQHLHINRKPLYLPFLISVTIAIMVCAILLLPTAFVILENSKSVADTSSLTLLLPDLTMNGLLYDPYGCGVSLIVWATLLLGLTHKKTRLLSCVLLISIFFPIIHYILNGFLYARTKILIVLLPLLLYLLCEVITLLVNKQITLKWYFIVGMFIPVYLLKEHSLVFIDCIITILVLYFICIKAKFSIVLPYLLVSMMICININPASLYLDKKLYESSYHQNKSKLLENIPKQRVADFSSPLYASNAIFNQNMYRASSYTSTNNSLYNDYLYDVMNQSIRSANRTANVDESNIFVQGMLGIQSIITTNKRPVGYELKQQEKKFKLYQNKNVMPLAYATSDVMSEDTFDKLVYPYTLDTIYNNAIAKKGNTHYQSKIQAIKLNPEVIDVTGPLEIDEMGNTYKVIAKKESTLYFNLASKETKQIMIIEFDVGDVHKQKEVSITINGIKNKLSKGNTHYPNHNQHFTYVLSSDQDIEQLKITFSKGQYSLNNIKAYVLDYDVIKQRSNNVDALIMQDTKNKEVLTGNIDVKEDGYFVTSLAYQKGYKAYIDNKEVPIEIVNKAFVGFPITEGTHHISIIFEAPFKRIGSLISIVGVLLLCITYLLQRRNIHV